MTRTTSGLAVAAVAAVLTAGTLAMDAGTTAALWRDSDTVSAQSITAGSLAISNITSTPGPETLELEPGGGQTLTTSVATLLDGTGLGGVLQMSYTWAASYAPEIVDALNVTAEVNGQDIAPTGSLTTGLEFEVLLLPTDADVPITWQGPVVFFDGSAPTVTFDLSLTATSETPPSWALGASGVSESGPTGGQAGDVAATLTQFSSGTTGPWSHDSTATDSLPVLYFYEPEEEVDATDSEATDDEVTDGDAIDGDATDDDATDGDAIDGDATDSEATDSEATDDDATDDDATDGEVTDGGKEPEGDPGTAGDTKEAPAAGLQDDVSDAGGSQTDPPGTDVEPEASVLESAALLPGKNEAAYVTSDDDDGGDQE